MIGYKLIMNLKDFKDVIIRIQKSIENNEDLNETYKIGKSNIPFKKLHSAINNLSDSVLLLLCIILMNISIFSQFQYSASFVNLISSSNIFLCTTIIILLFMWAITTDIILTISAGLSFNTIRYYKSLRISLSEYTSNRK